jgi:hypothetical protein
VRWSRACVHRSNQVERIANLCAANLVYCCVSVQSSTKRCTFKMVKLVPDQKHHMAVPLSPPPPVT